MKWYEIILLLLLIPAGAYLRNQTYRNVHGDATIGRDIERLWKNLQRWRRDSMERKKYNKRLKIKDNGKEDKNQRGGRSADPSEEPPRR